MLARPLWTLALRGDVYASVQVLQLDGNIIDADRASLLRPHLLDVAILEELQNAWVYRVI